MPHSLLIPDARTCSRCEPGRWHRLMFVTSYYDGPLEGLVAAPCGTVGYFACDFLTRECHVYPLTPDEIADELASKELFEEHVGTYWSWDLPDEQRVIHDTDGYEDYLEATARRFPDVDLDARRAGYLSREPVGVLCPN